MKLYYKEPNIKIYNVDAITFLKELPPESIDCMITSPPYWALRDYGISPTIWDEERQGCCRQFPNNRETFIKDGHVWGKKIMPRGNKSGKPGPNATVGARFAQDEYRRGKGTDFCSLCGAWRGTLGLEPTFELYIKHLCDIFDEIKRVLKKTGTCWVNIGDTYSGAGRGGGTDTSKQTKGAQGKENLGNLFKIDYPDKSLCQIPSHFSIEMTNRGWILRNEIIWFKPNCMPSSVRDRFTVDFEKIFFFVKNKKYWFERQFEALKSPFHGKSWEQRKAEGEPMRHGLKGAAACGAGTLGGDPQGRNKRCVWRITTQPFKKAHFAVFPEALVEIPIKAGCPEFVCNKCGKVRDKIYKQGDFIQTGGGRKKDTTLSDEQKQKAGYHPQIETGYTSCSCNASFSGGIILDPFMGSGTVGVVAKRLNRQFIGIDMKEGYVKMAIKRIQNTQKNLFL